jgi:23S rRNA-/tRNA-specific pseudouridylate synthase
MSPPEGNRAGRFSNAWTVPADAEGVRLDKFLASADRLGSRGRAVRAVECGKVFLNGDEAGHQDLARRLAAGDIVGLWMDRPGTARRPVSGRPRKLEIVFEDSDLIVVNKPAGLLSVPLERRESAGSVYELIEQHWRSHGKRSSCTGSIATPRVSSYSRSIPARSTRSSSSFSARSRSEST